jgi:hypothetical protein
MDAIAFGFAAYCAINAILAVRKLVLKRRKLEYPDEEFIRLDL